MHHHHGPMFWSFSLGEWFATQIRVSYFSPALLLLLGFRLEWQWQLVSIIFSIVVVSVFLHEMVGHVLVARLTGGSGSEVLLYPLGGLATTQPAPTLLSQLLTPAGGPLVHLVICCMTLPATYNSVYWSEAINPLILPGVDLSTGWLVPTLVLIFDINLLMMVVNLLPLYPLDGGQILSNGLSFIWDGRIVHEVSARVGWIVALLIMFVGLYVDSAMVVFCGAILLVLNMQLSHQQHYEDANSESFLGYDFSQGYTSLEQSTETRTQKQKSLWKRWQEKRQEDKLRISLEREKEDEVLLDAILEKVHVHGETALTDQERQVLNRASARFRSRKPGADSPE
ncbi:MAG: site-2 protease family protein [Planctomycetaceae bacterium]